MPGCCVTGPACCLTRLATGSIPPGSRGFGLTVVATGRRNLQDRKVAFNRITWILLNKGGLIGDITVGDCIEISNALQEHQCQGANNRPLFYALLAETGVLPAGGSSGP